MLDTTTQIKRTAALGLALAAVVAPSASARVADAQHVRTPPATPSGAAEPVAAAPTMADMATRREATASRAWHAANPPTIIEVSSPGEGGLDLTSAGIGAAVPLTLILEQQQRQQLTLARALHRDGAPVVGDLQRSEDAEVHGPPTLPAAVTPSLRPRNAGDGGCST